MAVIGSWKIMPTSPPRTPWSSRSESPRISRPSNFTLPVIETLESRTSPSSEYIATLLPEPDSPTMPRTSFAPTSKESPSTARNGPWRVAKVTQRSRTLRTGSVGVASDNAHPRIEQSVDDVNDGARQDDEEGPVHDGAHDDGQVEVLERVVGEESHAGQAEHHLGEQRRAADQRTDVEPEERRNRNERAAKRVTQEYPSFGQALGARGAHVVLVEGVHQFGAQHARVDPRVERREGQPREQEMQRPFARALGERHPARANGRCIS